GWREPPRPLDGVGVGAGESDRVCATASVPTSTAALASAVRATNWRRFIPDDTGTASSAGHDRCRLAIRSPYSGHPLASNMPHTGKKQRAHQGSSACDWLLLR